MVLNPKNEKIKSIEVYNIAGQKVFHDNTANNASSIKYRLRNLASGIYVIRLSTENNSILTKKIVVK